MLYKESATHAGKHCTTVCGKNYITCLTISLKCNNCCRKQAV